MQKIVIGPKNSFFYIIVRFFGGLLLKAQQSTFDNLNSKYLLSKILVFMNSATWWNFYWLLWFTKFGSVVTLKNIRREYDFTTVFNLTNYEYTLRCKFIV